MRKTAKIFSIIFLILLLTSLASADSWSKYFSEQESSYKKVTQYHYKTPYKYRDDYLLEENKKYSKTVKETYDQDNYYKPHRYNPGYKYYNYKPASNNYNPPYIQSKYRNDDDYVQWKQNQHTYYEYRDTSPYSYYKYYPGYGTYKKTCYHNPPYGSWFYSPCR